MANKYPLPADAERYPCLRCTEYACVTYPYPPSTMNHDPHDRFPFFPPLPAAPGIAAVTATPNLGVCATV